MAKPKQTAEKVKVAESAPAIAEVVNSAEGVAGSVEVKKEKAKAATSYEVISLPTQRDRLSPQLRGLVDAIDECTEDIEGKKIVYRARLLDKWKSKVGSESGDKVFASYMHQMLSFAFLDRVGTTTTPKKIISPMERKQKLLGMLSQLPEADRLELLAQLGGVK